MNNIISIVEQFGQFKEHLLIGIILLLVLFFLVPRARDEVILHFNLLLGIIMNHIISIVE